MAAGKVHESPFGKEMAGLRRGLDEHLGPLRRTGDRDSEINFRRLGALAEAMGDEDYKFRHLEESSWEWT